MPHKSVIIGASDLHSIVSYGMFLFVHVLYSLWFSRAEENQFCTYLLGDYNTSKEIWRDISLAFFYMWNTIQSNMASNVWIYRCKFWPGICINGLDTVCEPVSVFLDCRHMFHAVGRGGGEDGVWSPFWLSTYCATCKLTFPLRCTLCCICSSRSQQILVTRLEYKRK